MIMAIPHARAGFTIVELTIVVTVIAILSTFTLTNYASMQARSRSSAADAALAYANKKVITYKVFNNAYPASLAAAEVSSSNGVTYQYTNGGTTYCITAKVGTTNRYSQTGGLPEDGYCAGHTP